jgi:protein-S-isoprenylcysteine O-methyltransferase Ste14
MSTAERPNRFPWPPILLFLAIALPFLLQSVLPLPVIGFGEIADDVMVAVGWALIALGVTVIWLAAKSFMALDTPVNPTRAAEKLVTFGLYNRTRNPIYLGDLLIVAGVTLSTGYLWHLAAVPLLAVGLQMLAIRPEEEHLFARFGQAYADYAARVPRWW